MSKTFSLFWLVFAIVMGAFSLHCLSRGLGSEPIHIANVFVQTFFGFFHAVNLIEP